MRTSPWARRSVPVRAREPGSRVRIAKDGGVTRRQESRGPAPARRGREAAAAGAATRPLALDSLPSMAGCAVAADRDRILRGLRSSGFGMRTSSTPLLNEAVDGLGVDALGQRQGAREAAERALDAVVALLASSCSALRSPESVRTLSSSSIARPPRACRAGRPGGRSARRVSSRSIAGIHRRAWPPLPPAVGASKTVLNSRFISFWRERAREAAPSARWSRLHLLGLVGSLV